MITMLGKVWYLWFCNDGYPCLRVRPQLCTYRIRGCDLHTELQGGLYIYMCHIEWMSDRMSNRISWFMPERKSNRASEYINISAIYNSRWYARNCVTIASRVASFEVEIVHVLPFVSQKVVETKNYIHNIYIWWWWWQYAGDCWLTRVYSLCNTCLISFLTLDYIMITPKGIQWQDCEVCWLRRSISPAMQWDSTSTWS